MSSIPTESRIFATQYLRELRRREALHANLLAPGTKQWPAAINAVFDEIGNLGSPIKRAAHLRKITKYLNNAVTDNNFAHFLLDYGGATRSAALILATLSAGEHPLLGVNEDGVNIVHHYLATRRNGSVTALTDLNLAYVSKHAIARLHERGFIFDADIASSVIAFIGVLGLITRQSAKHRTGGMCLRFDDTLIVGSLKRAEKPVSDTQVIDGSLLDIRTALPANEMDDHRMIEQGKHAAHAVDMWLRERTINRSLLDQLAETIPYLPRRDDYTLQAARAAMLEKEQS